MPLELSFEKIPPVQIVSLRGRLDSAASSSFEESMKQLTDAGERHILLDCSELRYVSSVGLGLFVASAKVLQGNGGNLYFSSLTQPVRSVFEMVGFLGIFQVYGSTGEALEHPDLKNLS